MEPPSLSCFMCEKVISGGVDFLVRHFRHVHGLTVTAESSKMFVCGQGSCERDFQHMNSFRRHIVQNHYQAEANNVLNENEVINRPVDDEQAMDVDNEVNEYAENVHLPPNTEEIPQASNLHSICLNLIAHLRSKTSITGVTLNLILDEVDSLLKDTSVSLMSKVKEFLSAKNLLDDNEAQILLNSFHLETPFGALNTLEKQVDAFKTAFGFVEPVDVPLGSRIDSRLDKTTLTYVQTEVYETCQYVPIIEVLKLMLSNQTFRDAIKTERPSRDGVLSSFIDSQQYKSNAFYHNCDFLIRLQLYYDELEIVNPLGSKTGVHKVGVFYYTIQNLPRHVNSSLQSIHVLAICYDDDRKKYGFKKILTPFLYDLKKLESGIICEFDGGKIDLRATIAGFSGDGLSVHDVFGLLSPSANKFCGLCLISRQDLHEGSFPIGPRRTRAVHEEHLALLDARAGSRQVMTDTGVAGDCALHSSATFHVTQNFIFDIMHDILEGVGRFELKLVLHHYICEEELFSVTEFNHKVKSFNYGFVEVKNKPSANFTLLNVRNLADHKIKQRAMQTWLLLRVFPFLLDQKVPPGDKFMHLILLLLRIMEIVFSPAVPVTMLPYLADLIEEHHNLFLSLFPTVQMINKHHHIVHYPECILQCGPLRNYWCMRFEAKHNTLKKHSQVINCFKNPPKTLARICQFIQSNAYGQNRFQLKTMNGVSGESVRINDTLSTQDLISLGYPVNKSVFSAKSLKLNGVVYRLGLVVVLQSNMNREDNVPLFGKIVEIVVINSEVFLKSALFKCLYLDTDFNAYRVVTKQNHEYMFVAVSSLADRKPASLWTLHTPKRQFITFRHILF